MQRESQFFGIFRKIHNSDDKADEQDQDELQVYLDYLKALQEHKKDFKTTFKVTTVSGIGNVDDSIFYIKENIPPVRADIQRLSEIEPETIKEHDLNTASTFLGRIYFGTLCTHYMLVPRSEGDDMQVK